MTNEKRKKLYKDIYYALMSMIPVMVFGNIATETFTSINSAIAAGLGGMIGGGIGMGMHALTFQKSLVIKIISVIGIIVISFGSLVYIVSNIKKKKDQIVENANALIEEQNFTTCEVCGYKAYSDIEGCDECLSWMEDEEMKELGIKDKYVYLKFLQADYFLLANDIVTENVFFEPYISEEEYIKDTTWKPTITFEELKQLQPLFNKLKPEEYNKLAISILSAN